MLQRTLPAAGGQQVAVRGRGGGGSGYQVVPKITAQPTPQGLYARNTAGEETGESTLAHTGQTTAGPTTVQGSKHR